MNRASRQGRQLHLTERMHLDTRSVKLARNAASAEAGEFAFVTVKDETNRRTLYGLDAYETAHRANGARDSRHRPARAALFLCRPIRAKHPLQRGRAI